MCGAFYERDQYLLTGPGKEKGKKKIFICSSLSFSPCIAFILGMKRMRINFTVVVRGDLIGCC